MKKDMLGQIVRKLVQVPVEKLGMLYRFLEKLGQVPESALGMLYDLLERLSGRDKERWRHDLGKFLRGEALVFDGTPIRRWPEHDGVIYLTVTSDGTTGIEWIARLERKNFHLSDHAKNLLLSSDFHPTNSIIYQVAIVRSKLFSDSDRVTKEIRAEAARRQLITPNAEVACLIYDSFSNEEIRAMELLWILIMHKRIEDFHDVPWILALNHIDKSVQLDAGYGGADDRWDNEGGFAFVVSQTETTEQHVIDCEADPFIPENHDVEEHRKSGQLLWNPDEVELYLCDEQKKRGGSIQGKRLYTELSDKPILNTNVLDYLLKNPELIPKEWRGEVVFFWGTIYRYRPDGCLYIRCLFWSDGKWGWIRNWIGIHLRGSHPAAILNPIKDTK